MRWMILGVLQAATLWGVYLIWKEIASVAGFVGLAIWLAGCYWIANKLDRASDQRFMDELKRRGGAPPSIIIGGIAGWLAEQFMKSQMGLLMNIPAQHRRGRCR